MNSPTAPQTEAEAKVLESRLRHAPAHSAHDFLHELQVHQIELEMQNETLRQTQLELEASRDEYADLYDFSPTGYLTLSDIGLIAKINLTAANLLGIERTHSLDCPFDDFIVEEDLQRWQAHFYNAIKHDGMSRIEVRLTQRASQCLTVKINCLRYGKVGESPTLRITLTDITDLRHAEEALRVSRAQLKSFIENAPISIAMFDRDMNYLVTSACWLAEFGRGYTDLTGRNHYDFLPDLPANWKNIHQQAMAGVAANSDGEMWVQGDGSRYWLKWSVSPWINENGAVGGIVIATEDITQRKVAEESLRLSETRERARLEELEVVLEAIPSAVFIAQDVSCLKMSGNHAATELLGLPSMANVSRSAPESERPDFEVWAGGRALAADELPVQRAAASGEEVQEVELELRFRDGKRKHIIGGARPLFDENGAVRGAVGSFADFTAKKEVEEDLRHSEQFKESVLNSMAANIAVVDQDGVILAVNECWRAFSRDSSRQPGRPAPRTDVGTNYFSVLNTWPGETSADMDAIRQGIQDVIDRRVPSYSLEYACHAPDAQRWFQMIVSPLGQSGQGAVIVHADISASKKVEFDLAAMRVNMQEILCWQVARHTVAAIAHELNQPLASLSALSATISLLLADKASRPEQLKQLAQRLAEESQRAGGTVHQLMDSLHKPKVHVEATSLPGLIRRVAQNAKTITRMAYKIKVVCPPDLPPVLANPLQIEKVLFNLIGNSVDAMRNADKTTGQVLITAGIAANAAEVWVAVEDEGPGVAPEMATQLFQPFMTSKATGLGMGLAISHSLIEAQGGRLVFEDHAGPGAAFRFTLPTAR